MAGAKPRAKGSKKASKHAGARVDSHWAHRLLRGFP